MAQSRRLLLLDCLRGIAALVVVFHHLQSLQNDWFAAALESYPGIHRLCVFLSNLHDEAVMFFFFLSGFVIALSTKRLNLLGRKDLNYYLFRRFRRILPLYWFALIATGTIGLMHGHHGQEGSYGFLTLLGNLLFLQSSPHPGVGWVVPYGTNGPLWSLSYEMFYYLFLPLYLFLGHWFFCRFKKEVTVSWLLYGSFALAVCGIGARQILGTPWFSFLSLFPVWMAGYFLGRLHLERERADWTVCICTCACIGALLLQERIGSDTVYIVAKSWLWIAVPCYICYRLKSQVKPLVRILESILCPLFLRVGAGSYAIYLLHYPMLLWLQEVGSLSFWQQTSILVLWCVCLMEFEIWLTKRPFAFFDRQYV